MVVAKLTAATGAPAAAYAAMVVVVRVGESAIPAPAGLATAAAG
jgi:hypothetical protein